MTFSDQAKPVFEYFEKINQIPRTSGNCEEISKFIAAEGERLGHRVIRDELGNVVILSKASKGYEDQPTIMLQGHMDMVGEKTQDSPHDFLKDPIKMQVEGDYITADQTTLGGDDGVAVAYMLAILSDPSIKRPALECVFTVDEEVGLLGAKGIDLSFSKANYMINIDNDDEGSFVASCAGGARGDFVFPVRREKVQDPIYKIILHSSLGGHSGMAISKDRPNTNLIFGWLLREFKDLDFRICSVQGGTVENAIPNHTEILIASKEEEAILSEKIAAFERLLNQEFSSTEARLSFSIKAVEEMDSMTCFDAKSIEKVELMINQSQNGPIYYNQNIKGLVDTSLNLGIIENREDSILITYSYRSSIESRKHRLIQNMCAFCEYLGGKSLVRGDYPGWNYNKDSKLYPYLTALYEDLFKEKKARVEALHVGLECGFFASKKPDLEIVSLGPDILSIHTPEEKLSISSTERIYEFLLKVLERTGDLKHA